MMMFLAGSGVSTLAHSTRVDLGAVFNDKTDGETYIFQSQPTQGPLSSLFDFRGEILGTLILKH